MDADERRTEFATVGWRPSLRTLRPDQWLDHWDLIIGLDHLGATGTHLLRSFFYMLTIAISSLSERLFP